MSDIEREVLEILTQIDVMKFVQNFDGTEREANNRLVKKFLRDIDYIKATASKNPRDWTFRDSLMIRAILFGMCAFLEEEGRVVRDL